MYQQFLRTTFNKTQDRARPGKAKMQDGVVAVGGQLHLLRIEILDNSGVTHHLQLLPHSRSQNTTSLFAIDIHRR